LYSDSFLSHFNNRAKSAIKLMQRYLPFCTVILNITTNKYVYVATMKVFVHNFECVVRVERSLLESVF